MSALLEIYPIFQNQETPFLSCLADAMRRFALSFVVLFYLVWPKMNYSYTCLSPLATLFLIDVNTVVEKYVQSVRWILVFIEIS